MLRVIIVEDEKHSQETLRNMLVEFCPEVEVCGIAENVDAAVDLVHSCRPDLLFLDVELQTGTGFDVLDQLAGLNFEVIFTTAFEQYAIKAIKLSSIDYLLKPIDLDELLQAVEKAREKKSAEENQAQLQVLLSNLNRNAAASHRICLATSEGLEFLQTDDILFCEANGSYTNFFLKNGNKIIVSKNLKEYELLLGEGHFMRVHNKYLINLHEVKRFVKSDGGYILMKNDAQISISPRRRDDFLYRMAELN